MNASSTWFCSAQSATATLVNSGPLSNRIRCGRPLVSASRSSTLMTLLLPRLRSISIASTSRRWSSITLKVRNRRPSPNASLDEIRRPALVRTDGNRQWLRMPRRNTPLILSTLVQLHLAVNTVHTLVVPTVPVGFEQIVELPKSEIGMVSGEIAQSFDQRRVVPLLRRVPIHPSRYQHRFTRTPLTKLMFRFQIPDRLSPQRRHQPFFSISPFNARFSKLISAYIAFSFAFSSSSSRSLLISLAVIPPYFAFQLKYVESEIECSRHTSATFRPFSTAFNIPNTCPSLKLTPLHLQPPSLSYLKGRNLHLPVVTF